MTETPAPYRVRRLPQLKGHPRRRLRRDLRELEKILRTLPAPPRALALVRRMHEALDSIPVAKSDPTCARRRNRDDRSINT